MKIAIVANSGWYLYNFRRSLMSALRSAGHNPVAMSPSDEYAKRLVNEGFEHISVPLTAAGVNPARELLAVWRLRRALEQGGFDAVFTYTPKINIYVGLAVKGLGIEFVPNVSGLGRVFIARSRLTTLVAKLYRHAFRSAHTVVFQNDDDRREFLQLDLVSPGKTIRVPGSGVDLQRFTPTTLPRKERDLHVILFVGRVLRDKGIDEFVEAARTIRRTRPDIEFHILGSVGSSNPAAIPAQTVEEWVAEGIVTYLGTTDDVRPAISAADCVVLPSYREGVPRSLLEAAAMGKPCITTNVPGCRDAVDADVTGLVCEPHSAVALATALERFMAMSDDARAEMGRRARRKMETEFDESIVLRTYLELAATVERTTR